MSKNIDVWDLCNLHIEGTGDMKIWSASDVEKGNDGIVFEGMFDEACFSEWKNCEVESFGIEDGVIVINIA